MQTIHIFVSYSHEDDLWVKEGRHGLIPWLARQLRSRGVEIWHDHALQQLPGEDYKKLIKSEIDRADFAILLISMDFLGSEFIQEYELPWIRQRVEATELGVIPILVAPVLQNRLGWLADRQMLPGPPTPLLRFVDKEAEWKEVRNRVLEGIENSIDSLRQARTAKPSGEQKSAQAGAASPALSRASGESANAASKAAVSEKVSAPSLDTAPGAAKPAVRSDVPEPKHDVAAQLLSADSVGSVEPVPPGPQNAVQTPARGTILPAPTAASRPGPFEATTNSIGMQMVRIPAGEFLMGSPDSDGDARPNEKPQHQVRITKPFYLGIYPVTVGQFRQFARETGHKTDGEKAGDTVIWSTEFVAKREDNPVTFVSWNDAVAFFQWLSLKEGETYRLPTEAEWEYACRAGTKTIYSFGDDATGLRKYAWIAPTNGNQPVGQKLPNVWGLFDMHGNVWEWCADWYADDHYVKLPPDDPQGPLKTSYRVIRGGGRDDDARGCRSAYRYWGSPVIRLQFLGFRLARSLSGE
jgi:formylglycine-generating enzyme required for sulfatase activity